MGRIPIDHIASPAGNYQIRRGRTPGLSGFESAAMAHAEDRTRIKLANRRLIGETSRQDGVWQLVRHVERTGRRLHRSLASAAYMRDLRQRISGQLWHLVEQTLGMRPRTLSLFVRGWEVPAGQLWRFNPRQRLNAVRSLINRCGGSKASGYLIAFIHGEFEPNRQVYQLHLHILAAGGLLDILDQEVRDTALVRSNREAFGRTEFVRQRLRIDRRLNQLPRPLTYLLKSYWPSRWQGRNAAGKLIRQRRGSRIAEPHHTEVLLWLDRWRLSDITLLMNLSVDRTGFRLADRAYTNGDDQ